MSRETNAQVRLFYCFLLLELMLFQNLNAQKLQRLAGEAVAYVTKPVTKRLYASKAQDSTRKGGVSSSSAPPPLSPVSDVEVPAKPAAKKVTMKKVSLFPAPSHTSLPFSSVTTMMYDTESCRFKQGSPEKGESCVGGHIWLWRRRWYGQPECR